MAIISKLAVSKLAVAILIVISVFAIAIPAGLWYFGTSNNNSLPQQISPSPFQTLKPTITEPPSEVESPTPTINSPSPSNLPSPSNSFSPSPSPSQTTNPTIYPTLAPLPATPTPLPNPTYPPLGAGPSVTEKLVQENTQNILDGLNYLEKSDFLTNSNATLGNWSAYVIYSPLNWVANARVRLAISLSISKNLLSEFQSRYTRIDNASVLVTAVRDFDTQGYQHNQWDNTLSTILTPSGLPIEGGGSAAISRYNGYTQRSPVDIMFETPFSSFIISNDRQWTTGALYGSFDLPNNLPPGIYRLRMDFGFKISGRYIDFNNNTIGTRPTNLNSISCLYSKPIYSTGWNVDSQWIDGLQIPRKPYWVLLWDYNSNGYRGVVAQEEQSKVAISPRSIIHDAVVLPKVDSNGNAVAYNLEPNFLMDNDNTQRNIPMDYRSGKWTVKITLPNGTITNLGAANFLARRGNGATTQNASFTSWKPPMYGNYTIEAKGWILDIWGNRYEGGGTYTFWIAQRLTVATATFQGMPYNVGNRYGRDLAFNPPVPANVTVKAQLYINSDINNVTTLTCNGTATKGGIFGAAQGMGPLMFTAPGEYIATVTATYVDTQGVLWVAAMTHAGVVYPTNSTIEAHGKKLTSAEGQLVDRGQTRKEGFVAANSTLYLQHINFPYNFGDSLLIASEYQGANKIEPVLTYTTKGSNITYNSSLQTIGRTNLVITTSNGLSPEMFPEYITNRQYYYGAAVQPGFNSRFLVAHDNTRAPYWPTSNTNFGGQYGASNNGDITGTIYRLMGGVVVKSEGQNPAYAGYQASAFILPKGSNNNRVIGPGDEDLPSPDGVPARFFLVPIRPGSVFPSGSTFGAVLQIDPIVPCNVTFTLTAPDNTTYLANGQGDQYGYFVATNKWTLDQAGVWSYKVNATWNGYQGKVPGLPETGGWIYVIENSTSLESSLILKMPMQQAFSVSSGLNITGETTASKVYYAAIIPGAVLDQGTIAAVNGIFQYKFNPQTLAQKIQTYDIINMVNGRAEIGKIVHLTFFTEEKASNGTTYHSFARVVLRGTIAVYVKER